MDSNTEKEALLRRMDEMQEKLDRLEREREIAEAERRGREQGRRDVWDGVKKAATIIGWAVAVVSGIAGAVWMVSKALASAGLI